MCAAIVRQTDVCRTGIVSVEVNLVFPLNSPGKVSTPMAATPSAPVEISDNFNTRYLLGRACRDVLQHGQVCCLKHALCCEPLT